jgi:hypothetical protein
MSGWFLDRWANFNAGATEYTPSIPPGLSVKFFDSQFVVFEREITKSMTVTVSLLSLARVFQINLTVASRPRYGTNLLQEHGSKLVE